jgi:hypothetical protein
MSVSRVCLEEWGVPNRMEQTMAKDLHAGDHVKWNTSQGETEGEVIKKLTRPMKIKTHAVKASKSDPEYLVRSDKSGEKAAHKPGALKKT